MAADSKLQSRPSILLFSVAAITVGAGCALLAGEDGTITLRPGQDLQAIVQDSPEGTHFHFAPGIYRQQTIHPKSRQEFIGQDGVILNGAMKLTSWSKQGRLWHTEDELPPPLPASGGCQKGRDLCELREDLFVNDRLYVRVESDGELGPGQWYYQDGRAYLADDPTGQAVEPGVTPVAFAGDADDVVLRDLVVEKYASEAQHGAIEFYDGRGWSIVNVTARWNHGVGLFFGPEARVSGGFFGHNGQLGMAGTGNDSVVERAEIAYNNYAGFSARWEAGGTKFHRTRGLVVRDSCVHHNGGPGLWTDIDNIQTLYYGNKVFSNANDGIKHEISYKSIIRNNVVAHNGKQHDTWLWGSQILIQNSNNVRVYDNLVQVSDEFGNGISVIHQDRGEGEYGAWVGFNNHIYRNIIIHSGRRGQSGVAKDTDDHILWHEDGNKYDRNTYVVPNGSGAYWHFNDLGLGWDEVKDLGYERRGELVIEQRRPTELSCDR
jgi:Right handed beta helix region